MLELEGDGVPIVMFHGYADSADTWRQMLAQLAREGRRAIAVDLPGFGTADRLTPRPDPAAARRVRRRGGALRRRPSAAQPVIAVGNSLGGCVSLRLAERHPERLAGVVGIAPAGLEMTRLLYLVQRDPVLHSLLALPTPVPGVVLRAAVARLYRQLAFADPGAIDAQVVVRVHLASPRALAGRALPRHRAPADARAARRRSSSSGSRRRCCSSGETATGSCSTAARSGAGRRAGFAARAARGGRPLPAGRGAGARDASCCSSSAASWSWRRVRDRRRVAGDEAAALGR